MRDNDINSRQEMIEAGRAGPDPTVDEGYYPDPKDGGAQPDIGSVLDNARKLLQEQTPEKTRQADAGSLSEHFDLSPAPNVHDGPDRANTKDPPLHGLTDLDINPEQWAEEQQAIDAE